MNVQNSDDVVNIFWIFINHFIILHHKPKQTTLWEKEIKKPGKGKFSGALMEKDARKEKTKETNLLTQQITNKSSQRGAFILSVCLCYLIV